ncbi:MAG: Uma2 family endonuclease [Eubacterium sp.]|nr:Uma2 family endonuclease [Eubacterium sp.]
MMLLREALADYAASKKKQFEIPEEPQQAAEFLLRQLIPGKQQGDYTIDDLAALPDGLRFELIDGYLFVMESPSFRHQTLSMLLASAMSSYILENRSPCSIVPSWDVRPDPGRKTLLEPDIQIFREASKNTGGYLKGAPDFVIEILSPSTRRKDEKLKLRKYREIGVRECWLIDPAAEWIKVYHFHGKAKSSAALYSFRDTIPVGICESGLRIDFSKILEQLLYLTSLQDENSFSN